MIVLVIGEYVLVISGHVLEIGGYVLEISGIGDCIGDRWVQIFGRILKSVKRSLFGISSGV